MSPEARKLILSLATTPNNILLMARLSSHAQKAPRVRPQIVSNIAGRNTSKKNIQARCSHRKPNSDFGGLLGNRSGNNTVHTNDREYQSDSRKARE